MDEQLAANWGKLQVDNFTIVVQTFCTDLASENWKTVKKNTKTELFENPTSANPK